MDAKLVTQQTLMKTSPFCLHSRNVKQAVQKRKLYQNKLGLVPIISLVPSINNQPGQEHLLHPEGLLSIVCAPQHSSHDSFPPKLLSVHHINFLILTKPHCILGMVRGRGSHCLMSGDMCDAQ